MIQFGRKPNKPDLLTVRSAFPPTMTLGYPPLEAFEITLSNANGVVYHGELQVGDLAQKAQAFRFKDPLAKKGLGIRDGLAWVELRPVPKDGGMRITVKAYGDLSAAILPEMTVVTSLGGQAVGRTMTWERKGFGWKVYHR